MCRLYKTKKGDYVRLCYYHGDRRGEKIPFFSLPMDVGTALLEHRIIHVPKEKKKGYTFTKPHKKSDPIRCKRCNAPLNRANYLIGICCLCQERK